ncbi:hypothetical protein DYB38_003569, partial [Aphanomyces astaci]
EGRRLQSSNDLASTMQHIDECAVGVCKASADAAFADDVCGNQTFSYIHQCPDTSCLDTIVANVNKCVTWGDFVACASDNCFGSPDQGNNTSPSGGSYYGNATDGYYGNQTGGYNGWPNTTGYVGNNGTSYPPNNAGSTNYPGSTAGSGSYSGGGNSGSSNGNNDGGDFTTILAQLQNCTTGICIDEAVNATGDMGCGAAEISNLLACTDGLCLDNIVKASTCESFRDYVECVSTKCFRDDKGGGGNSGSSTGTPDANSCPAHLVSYCTANPDDASCALPCPFNCYLQPNCPCQEDACTATASAPFCVREDGVCSHHGAFNPSQEWQRQQVAQYLVPPTPYDPTNDTSLSQLWQQCNQAWPQLADNIASCLNTSITYCNKVGWDQACSPGEGATGVSECGDGFVTFGETCDDGNNVGGDGCSSMCQTEDTSRYSCLEQGKPCFACTRPYVQYGSNGQPLPGQFCTNDRLVIDNETVPQSSPIYYPSCASITSIDDAIDCDVYANTFCANLTLQGTSDPACQPYVNLTRKYTVPTVAQSCEYQVKEIDIGTQGMTSAKVGLRWSLGFGLMFQDPYGLLSAEDATPIYKFRNPFTSLSKSWKDKITANATIDPQGQIDEFGNNPNCWASDGYGSMDVIPLPPTTEPTKWAMKAILMRFRYEALNWNDWSKKEFANFNAWDIDGGSVYQDATLNFGVLLSTSSKDGNGKIQENVQRTCSDWNVPWQDQATSPLCTTIEQALVDGRAFLKFDQQLFQKGCASDQCEYKVDHCRRVPLTKRTLVVDKTRFVESAATVVALASSIDQAKTWEDLVGNTVKVAVEAASESFTDPVSLFWSLVVKGKQTKFLKNVPNYCKFDYYNDTSYSTVNPKWKADPCCNWEMRQYLCCTPQDIPNGEIDVVLSTADTEISTHCPGVGAQIRDVVQSTMKALQRADSCSADLDSSTGYDSWKTMSAVSDTCRTTIQKAGSVDCKKDSDCSVCSQSTCQRDKGVQGAGKCTVPWDDMEGCTLECYQKTMDSELLRYLYDQWDLSVTATVDEKKAKFTEMMSEPTCSGPQAWMPDIGYNGWTWQMNTTCQKEHICDDYDYQNYLQNVANQQQSGGYYSYSWLDFRNNDTCALYNGTTTCTSFRPDGECYDWGYQCTFDQVRGPCKDVNQCYQTCQAPYSQTGCASLNGSWFTSNGYGQCCPPDAYFNVSGTNSICSYAPPNSPNSWSVNDETCCRAAKGIWWTQVDYYGNSNGQCCFGKMRPYADYLTGAINYQCQQDFWGWDNSDCYDTCNSLQQSCTQCKLDSSTCQGTVHKLANKTACLSYSTCNQGQYQPDECRNHVGDEPFCAQCWGSWCYKQGNPATCTLYQWGTDSCANAGGVWDWRDYRCHINGTQDTLVDPWSCFSPGPAVCPDPRNNSRAYGPGELVPAYSFRDNQCESGCYVPASTADNCTSDKYWSIRWKPQYGNGSGACAIETWQISADDCANEFNGVYVGSTIVYNGGQFSTKDQCDQGICQGGLSWDGWSRKQCEDTPKFQCSQQCEQCLTWNWPFYAQDSGGCFSTNATYCQGLGLSDVPVRAREPFHIDSKSACDADADTFWVSCSDFNGTTCGNASNPYISKMSCQWGWGQCKTQEACEAQGECNDWDSMRQQCGDDGWDHGDTCYASWADDVFDSNTNSSVTQWHSAYCSNCQSVDGVCVIERPIEGCQANMYDMWHSLGCRVDGVHNETACYAFNEDAGWLTKAKTKDACLAPGYYGGNNKNLEECTKCGGTGKPYYTWWGGVWSRPYVQDLKWMANGTQLIPVNQYDTILFSIVQDQLALPMVRKLANAKKTQALLSYNAFSSSLAVIACACGSSKANASSCFDQISGSIEGITDAFCDSSAPVSAGCSKAVVQKNCSSPSGRRRLADGAPAAGDDKLAITTTYYSAGPFASALEPFCNATDRMQRNPLAVRNSHGVIVGQLMGDGKGILAPNTDIICLEMSLDIRVVDKRFPTYDVATLVNGTFSPLFLTSFVSLNAQTMCFLAKQSAIYFPITRLAVANLNAITCNQSCVASNGICVYSGATNSTSCVCNCGYSGVNCEIGCVNQCSSQGTCTNNKCVCFKGFTGTDCSEYDCPVANGKKCSGNGICNANATCTCNNNFKGDDCSQAKVTQAKTIVLPKGLAPASTSPKTSATSTKPSTSAAVPGKDVTATTTTKPATFPPAPMLTPAPPLPTISSTCVASKCKTDFDTCMATFDSCACFPGQLLCVQTSCSSEYTGILATCKGLVAQATSCVLDCSPNAYPVKGDTTNAVVMAVVANIAIQGVTAAQFTAAVQDKFKQAIASAVAGVTADKVTIIKVTDVADARRRRLLDAAKTLSMTADGKVKAMHEARRQLAGSHLEIEFSISVSSPDALKATTSSLQGTSSLAYDGSDGNLILASTPKPADNTTVIAAAAGGGAAAVILLVCLVRYCYKKRAEKSA